MIKEEYVSFEVAKLLKDEGFNEECHHVYDGEKIEWTNIFYEGDVLSNSGILDFDVISAPTQQMAMRWLREVYGIYIDIETCYSYLNTNEKFEVTGYEFTIHSVYDPCYEDHKTYDSYEEAVEAVLLYVLKNLI